MSYKIPNLSQILARFEGLRQAPTGNGTRMPHKPLLILLMLGRAQRGDLKPVKFSEIRGPLQDLLDRFGPQSSPNVLDPFWRLQNDPGKVWVVRDAVGARVAESVSPPTIGLLEERGAAGSFAPDLCEAFRLHPQYTAALAGRILAENFPQSLHADIAAAVGLDFATSDEPEGAQASRSTRDPEFRSRILTAYEYRCAITGWDLRVGNTSAGIEAAHIRWHVAGGPSHEKNGLALNALHHKLFDLGVFTISHEHDIPLVLVSRHAHGGDSFGDMLLRFHRKPIQPPQDPAWLPDPEFIRWHQREVFKGDARV